MKIQSKTFYQDVIEKISTNVNQKDKNGMAALHIGLYDKNNLCLQL